MPVRGNEKFIYARDIDTKIQFHPKPSNIVCCALDSNFSELMKLFSFLWLLKKYVRNNLWAFSSRVGVELGNCLEDCAEGESR